MKELVLLTAVLTAAACSHRSVSNSGDSLPPPRWSDTSPPQATVYHLEGKVDAVNLALEPGGTFHWTINGCDFSSGDCGLWTAEGSGAFLFPRKGVGTFNWVEGGTFAAKAVQVKFRPGPAGDQVTASGVLVDGTAFKQTWRLGRMCPKCGGMGPISLFPCTEPLPAPASCNP